MIKIAIVDDEQTERTLLKTYFYKLAQELGKKIDIVEMQSGEELLENYDHLFQLICLDIQLDGKDGLSIAKKIRELDSQVILIFVTNFAHMAIEGYSVHALDFIIKPVQYSSFALKLQNVLNHLEVVDEKDIILKETTGWHKISSNNILYIEVEGHYLSYHTNNGIYKQKASLKKIEKELSGLPFYKCNNCYLVHLKYVNAIKKEEALVGHDWLKISRPRKKDFLRSLADYMGGVIR